MHLANGTLWVVDVLESLGTQDAIELCVLEGKLLPRADDIHAGPGAQVESDVSAFKVLEERLVRPRPTADVQDGDRVASRPTVRNLALELDTECPQVDIIRTPRLRV
jgi:hypothetical protein